MGSARVPRGTTGSQEQAEPGARRQGGACSGWPCMEKGEQDGLCGHPAPCIKLGAAPPSVLPHPAEDSLPPSQIPRERGVG